MEETPPLSWEELQGLRTKYERLLSEDPYSAGFVFLGEILRRLDEFSEATDILVRGLGYHPENITGRLILGRIYYDEWMIEAAKREIEGIIKSSPDNLVESKILAEIYRSEGNLEKALEVRLSAYFFSPRDEEIKNIIEEINKEIIIREKTKAAAFHPKDETLEEEDSESFLALFGGEIYTETMGDLYMSQKLYERAIRVFEKLFESDPENKSLQTRLERARARLIGGKTNC